MESDVFDINNALASKADENAMPLVDYKVVARKERSL
jgi:hypothetical protein